MEEEKRPEWVKGKTIHENFEMIDCPSFHPIKDFIMDDSCYLLIRINRVDTKIEVGICNYKHELLKGYQGVRAQDIYYRLLKDGWIKRLDHAAYLGKELKKAEIALATGSDYYQE